ncbi:AzlD domain-containing protein [Actinoplanes sp. NPDC026623]|uniref:branched-chain amino acid transporter permease n=1 Tax=Actinoplanes sp. NPDC026623 TaxID=3155610 RepID=UPI0033C9AECA
MALQKVAQAPLVRYLGLVMPAGVMVILVFYSLSTVELTVPPYGVPSIIGVGATLWMHAWRRNPLLSIVIGTCSYVGALHLMT